MYLVLNTFKIIFHFKETKMAFFYVVKENLLSQKLLEDSESEEKERRDRADILRRQRSQEAQQLIAKRTIDARAVFEQNTCALQMNRRRASYQPNGIQKKEISNVSPDVSPNEQPTMTSARKGSLPAWLPQPVNVIETEANPVLSNVLTNGNEKDVIKNHEVEKAIEEEQEWEGVYFLFNYFILDYFILI